MRCIWEQSLRGSDAGGCRSDPLRHSVTEVSYILCTKRVSWPPASTFGTNWTNTCVGQQCNLHTTRKYNHDAANTCNIVFRGRTEGSSRGAEGILALGQVAVNLRSYQLDSTFATVRQVWNRCMWNGSIHLGCSFVLSNNNHRSCNFEPLGLKKVTNTIQYISLLDVLKNAPPFLDMISNSECKTTVWSCSRVELFQVASCKKACGGGGAKREALLTGVRCHCQVHSCELFMNVWSLSVFDHWALAELRTISLLGPGRRICPYTWILINGCTVWLRAWLYIL